MNEFVAQIEIGGSNTARVFLHLPTADDMLHAREQADDFAASQVDLEVVSIYEKVWPT